MHLGTYAVETAVVRRETSQALCEVSPKDGGTDAVARRKAS
jgi:hypothetical protein